MGSNHFSMALAKIPFWAYKPLNLSSLAKFESGFRTGARFFCCLKR